jgi:hypothetical protein
LEFSFPSFEGLSPPSGHIYYHSVQAPKFSAKSTQRGAMDLLTAFVQGVMGSSPFSVLQPRNQNPSWLFGVFCISLSIDPAAGSDRHQRRCIGNRSMGRILAEDYELCITKPWTICEQSPFLRQIGPVFTFCSHL